MDDLLLHYAHEAARILEEKGLRPGQGRLRLLVEEGAGHHEVTLLLLITYYDFN